MLKVRKSPRILFALCQSEEKKDQIWQQILRRSQSMLGYGAYLINSHQVSDREKAALNACMNHIDHISRRNLENRGRIASARDMAIIWMDSWFHVIKKIMANYPTLVEEYKKIQQRSAGLPDRALSVSRFIKTWNKYHRHQLLTVCSDHQLTK